MSVVTSILLTMDLMEEGPGCPPEDGVFDRIIAINRWLADRHRAPLAYLTELMCTGKHPQNHTFGGGYNHFPEEEFIAFLSTLKWEEPENVVLVMQPEEGATIVWRPQNK